MPKTRALIRHFFRLASVSLPQIAGNRNKQLGMWECCWPTRRGKLRERPKAVDGFRDEPTLGFLALAIF